VLLEKADPQGSAFSISISQRVKQAVKQWETRISLIPLIPRIDGVLVPRLEKR
jgi:phage baseplate assembly protein W